MINDQTIWVDGKMEIPYKNINSKCRSIWKWDPYPIMCLSYNYQKFARKCAKREFNATFSRKNSQTWKMNIRSLLLNHEGALHDGMGPISKKVECDIWKMVFLIANIRYCFYNISFFALNLFLFACTHGRNFCWAIVQNSSHCDWFEIRAIGRGRNRSKTDSHSR